MTRGIGLIFAWLMAGGLSGAETGSSYVRTLDDRGWSIGNALIERTVRFTDERGLHTTKWQHKLTATDFVSRLARRGTQSFNDEFSFQVGGERLNGRASFQFSAVETLQLENGKALKVMLKERQGKCAVTVYYAVYDDHPVIRKWITITNTTQQPVLLTHLCFESINLTPGERSELQLWAGYGTVPRETFFTGRVSDAALVLKNSRTGEGLVVMNEAPGYLKRTEMAGGWSDAIRVMYDTDLFPFARTLQPGETFETAKSSIVFLAEGQGLADSHWVIPTYTSEILMRRGRSFQPPWLYNTWEPFQRKIDEAICSELISVAGSMGMDIFTIDDGWQAEYGDNGENLKSFPGGLARIREMLAEHRMGLGLWVPLAAISTETSDYKLHPEWLCRDREGEPKFTDTMAGLQAVMCLGSAYRESAAARLIQLIEKHHPKYLKVDLTTVFNTYGEEPGCNAPGHDHQSWAESLVRIYEGMQYVGKRLYREHPEVLLDFTFELWGEKHLIDHGLLNVADLDWLSNVQDAVPGEAGTRQARTLLYHRAFSIPVETMLIGNLHAATHPIQERFGAAIGSGPLLLGDLRNLTPTEQDWYAGKISWFKKLRRRSSLDESFFPLGEWRQTGVKTWDGFARLSRQGDGVIVVFRNDSGVRNVSVRLPCPVGARYRARSVVTGQSLGVVTTPDLEKGWTLPLDRESSVEIIELARVPKE
ncbi:MAG: alpha-galactosidase [Acidobacteriota bacterium]